MRPWLEEQINSNKIPGLKWLNEVRPICMLRADLLHSWKYAVGLCVVVPPPEAVYYTFKKRTKFLTLPM